MAIPDFSDTRGYDPYNHTGRLIRKKSALGGIETVVLGDKILMMDRPVLDLLRRETMQVKRDDAPWFNWWQV